MKKTVALIYGGEGCERDISIKSAENLSKMIDKELYEPVLIEIKKNGNWYIKKEDRELPTFPVMIDGKSGVLLLGEILQIDCAIPCLHGDYGEDGIIQGALNAAHIHYIGQDVYASAVTSDKIYSKIVAEHLRIPTAKYILLCDENSSLAEALASEQIGYPMFIKPARLGSSFGAQPVYTKEDFYKAYKNARELDKRVMAEELIFFDYEVECAFFDNGAPLFLPNGRILSSGKFYDYNEKYIKQNCIYTEIKEKYSPSVEEKIREYSDRLTRIIGISDLARLDYFVLHSGDVIFNEINAFPGMTETSLYPRLTELSGLQEGEFINKLIEKRCSE